MGRKQPPWEEMGVDLRRADERPPADIDPEEVRLKDGSPLYYAFLPKPDVPFLEGSDVQDAKNDLSRAIHENRDLVLRCQGQTREEALRILGLEGYDQAAA